jgi:dihydrolipoamide dehydrogenase
MNQRFDVAIIGAGSAGLSALREVRRNTDNFVLINDGIDGTTCARVGCMPSKVLIEIAKTFQRRQHFGEMGIRGARGLKIDPRAAMKRVRALRDHYVRGVRTTTRDLGKRYIKGRARFLSPQLLEVAGQRLHAERIVIATGARPIVPAAWHAFNQLVLTTDNLFEQTTLPRQMAVVGMGAIGVEMAQALARLGVKVTGFDTLPRVAGISDAAVNEAAVALLRDELPIHLGAPAELRAVGKKVEVRAGRARVRVDKVLAALGRRPNLDDLGLETLGVALDERGVPPFDPTTMQIRDLPVFIAGDVNGDVPLLHEAADEGFIAGRNAMRRDAECFQRRTPLAIVFTDPNIAVVGRSCGSLAAGEAVVGEVDLRNQGRLRMSGEDRGRIHVYADAKSGRLLGAELCAPRGEHLAHWLALAVQHQATIEDLLRAPFYHPVVEEGLRTALRNASKQLRATPGPDLAACEGSAAMALG